MSNDSDADRPKEVTLPLHYQGVRTDRDVDLHSKRPLLESSLEQRQSHVWAADSVAVLFW